MAGNRPLIDDAERRVLVVRSAAWVGARPLRLVVVDLLAGAVVEEELDVAAALPEALEWITDRVAVVRDACRRPGAEGRRRLPRLPVRARLPGPRRHDGGHVDRACPGARPAARRHRHASPRPRTTTWKRCPREYLLTHLLAVPPSDEIRPTDHGLLLHELLRVVHEQGTCRDADHVRDVLAGHGVDDPALRRDARAPHAPLPDAMPRRGVHEVDLARFHRMPAPMFMATARIDAIWVHDGILDARDYKTGARWYERVADDPRARVQAFVLDQHARRRGLRLRLRYEHLAAEVDDDPEPFEPDDDDLAAIEEELRATVAELWSIDEWTRRRRRRRVPWCRFRSICPDSAAAGRTGLAGARARATPTRTATRDRPAHTGRRRSRRGRPARRPARRARADRAVRRRGARGRRRHRPRRACCSRASTPSPRCRSCRGPTPTPARASPRSWASSRGAP